MGRECAVRWSDVGASAQWAPADKDAHAERVCSIGEVHRELRYVRDDPAQARDRNLAIHRLAIGDQGGRAGEVQRVIFSAPSRARDRAQAVHATAGELADPAGLQPFVAETRKGVAQPLGQRRQRRVRGGGVLMQKIDPQAGRQSSLTRERVKGIVHRVGVLAGDTRRWFVGMKRARVAMRGDAELRVVLQGIERRALPRLRGQQRLAQRLQGEPSGRTGDRAISRHRYASRFEPGLAFTVGTCATLCGLEVDRTAHRVELGERGQTALVELHCRDRSDRRDELTRGYARRTRLQGGDLHRES